MPDSATCLLWWTPASKRWIASIFDQDELGLLPPVMGFVDVPDGFTGDLIAPSFNTTTGKWSVGGVRTNQLGVKEYWDSKLDALTDLADLEPFFPLTHKARTDLLPDPSKPGEGFSLLGILGGGANIYALWGKDDLPIYWSSDRSPLEKLLSAKKPPLPCNNQRHDWATNRLRSIARGTQRDSSKCLNLSQMPEAPTALQSPLTDAPNMIEVSGWWTRKDGWQLVLPSKNSTLPWKSLKFSDLPEEFSWPVGYFPHFGGIVHACDGNSKHQHFFKATPLPFSLKGLPDIRSSYQHPLPIKVKEGDFVDLILLTEGHSMYARWVDKKGNPLGFEPVLSVKQAGTPAFSRVGRYRLGAPFKKFSLESLERLFKEKISNELELF